MLLCAITGLLVEPVATSFTKLCLNYQPMSTRIRAIKAAVSDFNGFADMQIMRNGCAGGQCNHLLHRGDNRRWHHRWARTNETERVPVITLARVWEELQRVHGPVADVDLLVVDVEGSEGRLLGSSELPSPRPRLIMFEHKHLTAPVRFMINSSLESLGYQFVGGVAGGVGGAVTARHGDWLWQRRESV
jgi:FkbM family methyltransferase